MRILSFITATFIAFASSANGISDWQLGFQTPASDVMRNVYDLHNFVLIMMTAITIFVLFLIFQSSFFFPLVLFEILSASLSFLIPSLIVISSKIKNSNALLKSQLVWAFPYVIKKKAPTFFNLGALSKYMHSNKIALFAGSSS